MQKISARAAGGEINGALELDLNRPVPAYSGNVDVQGLRLADILSASAGSGWSKVIHSGELYSNIKFSGKGTEWKTLRKFLTVDDNLSKVHVISNTGNIIRTLSFTGDDLEGVTYVPNDSSIYIVEEKKKEIVKLDTTGNEILRFPVSLNNTDAKHGLEGISYNPTNGHLFVVSEQSPSLLMEMTLAGEIIATHELSFAQDYSAGYFDTRDSSLWILSDKSKIVAKCDLQGNPVQQYSTGLEKFEGLIVDSKNGNIYLINDNTNILYVFSY